MTALTSNCSEWQTPRWLVDKIRATFGGEITLDAATSDSNPVGANCYLTKEMNALTWSWADWVAPSPVALFLNPPGDRSGKLVRRFWERWDVESRRFNCAVWVGFNLDQLRFTRTSVGDVIIIPRKRIAYIDPATGLAGKQPTVGSFLILRGKFRGHEREFPSTEYNYLGGG